MYKIKQLINGEDLKWRGFALILLAGTVYLVAHMMNLFLLTFIFSFLLYNLTSWIVKKLSRWVAVPEKLIIVLVYAAILAALILGVCLYIPVVAKQITDIIQLVTKFNIADYQDKINPKVYSFIRDAKIETYLKDGAAYLLKTTKGVGSFIFSLFLSFILSFFVLVERKKIVTFLKPFETGRVGFLYQYYTYFAKNFANTFGKMIQVRLAISLVNSLLSVICLYFLGFDQVWGWGVLIFVLGLIPVVGVIISVIPLSIIAFKIGGIVKIVHVLIMVIITHAIETYVLSPKMLSSTMKMPSFFSFAVLVVAEHVLGIWGFLIGIPLFMFIMDLLKTPEDQEVATNADSSGESSSDTL